MQPFSRDLMLDQSRLKFQALQAQTKKRVRRPRTKAPRIQKAPKGDQRKSSDQNVPAAPAPKGKANPKAKAKPEPKSEPKPKAEPKKPTSEMTAEKKKKVNCSFFKQGKCKFGENCHFNHPDKDKPQAKSKPKVPGSVGAVLAATMAASSADASEDF